MIWPIRLKMFENKYDGWYVIDGYPHVYFKNRSDLEHEMELHAAQYGREDFDIIVSQVHDGVEMYLNCEWDLDFLYDVDAEFEYCEKYNLYRLTSDDPRSLFKVGKETEEKNKEKNKKKYHVCHMVQVFVERVIYASSDEEAELIATERMPELTEWEVKSAVETGCDYSTESEIIYIQNDVGEKIAEF